MHSTILRRMTGGQGGEAADLPLTSSRAVKLALTKAANDTIGLVLTVIGMGEELVPLDDLLGALDENLMLMALERGGQLAGVVAVDVQLRAAMMEMQTVGRLIDKKAEDRAPTGTDKTMCEPVLETLLKALPQAMGGTSLDGWVDGALLGQRIASTRVAGLILSDHPYRIMRLSVDLGLADREGLLLLALPPVPVAEGPATDVGDDLNWDTQFQTNVADAPATLSAVLHRFRISLAQARNLEAGQMLPLPGCTVNSVRLISPDGHKVAQAKLGQIGGMRAVRIEQAPAPQLADLGGASIAAEPDMMMAASPDGLGDGEPLDLEDDIGMGLGGDAALDLAADPPEDAEDDIAMAPMDMDALSLTD